MTLSDLIAHHTAEAEKAAGTVAHLKHRTIFEPASEAAMRFHAQAALLLMRQVREVPTKALVMMAEGEVV
jgi:hypothetical protein